MWGIVTFLIPFTFSTSLNLKIKNKNGTSYDLDIVYIDLLHLRGIQIILGKIKNTKILKN